MATTNIVGNTAGAADSSRHTLPPEKFLTIAANLLHKAFVENSRTEAKVVFRDVSDGKTVPLTRLRMEDESEALFELTLDHSEFGGKLNFGSFRTSLAVLINHIAEAVKEPQNLRTFRNENKADAVLFGITAVTVEDGETNVMALGADLASAHATVQLQLMYLPLEQFAEGEQPGPEITA